MVPSVEIEPMGRHAVRLWINRPRELNVLGPEMMEALARAFGEVEADSAVRLVVFQGRGSKAFAAGADLAVVSEVTGGEQAEEFSRRGQAIFEHFSSSRLITIAAIEGYALGGGLELALSLDLRIATLGSKFGLPEVNLGLLPGFGGTQRLPMLIGGARALWLLMAGERINGGEAERIGLVHWAVEPAQFESTIQARVETLSSKPREVLPELKRLVHLAASAATLASKLDAEAQAFGSIMQTRDAREGMDAFLSRRPPKFDGQ